MSHVAHDEEGDTDFSYALTTAPTGASIDADTGNISWTPAADQIGDHDFVVTAQDAAGNTVNQSFTPLLLISTLSQTMTTSPSSKTVGKPTLKFSTTTFACPHQNATSPR